jgi:hypothetical protein
MRGPKLPNGLRISLLRRQVQKAVIIKRGVPATEHLLAKIMRTLQVEVKEVQRGTEQVFDQQQAHFRVFQLLVYLSCSQSFIQLNIDFLIFSIGLIGKKKY